MKTAASEVLDKTWKPLFRRSLGWAIAILLLLAVGLSWRLSPWSGLSNLPILDQIREAAVPETPDQEPDETPAGAEPGPTPQPGVSLEHSESELTTEMETDAPEKAEQPGGQPGPPPQQGESPARPESRAVTDVEAGAPEETAPPDAHPSSPPQQGGPHGLPASESYGNAAESFSEEALASAEPSPVPDPVNINDLLKGGAVDTSTAAVFETIFQLWGVDFDPKPGKTACDAALAVGLRCHHDRGNWTTLAYYGRPAVLELSDEARNLYLVVATALNDRDVTLDFSDREIALPRSQVERMWLGDFIILWKPPPLKSTPIRLGRSGPDVRWLKSRLDEWDGLPEGRPKEEKAPVFDEALKRRVMAFQSAHALEPDGVVGDQTLIRLTAVGKNASGPLLYNVPKAMRVP